MSEGPGYWANLQRGQLLRQSGRDSDACKYFKEAIQADPEQPQAYLELALALSQSRANQSESLRAVDRAVTLAPHSAHFMGNKAFLLSHFAKYKEALAVASQALSIDPNSLVALLAQANAYTKTAQWVKAEHATRRMLEIDAQNINALNLLAQALRFQRRLRESRELTARILAMVPNDSFGQTNAGYGALNVHDHRRANQHFLNALRVNPFSEHARLGLLQSLRERVWIYRTNLKLILFFNNKKAAKLLKLAIIFLSAATFGIFLAVPLIYFFFAGTLQPISNFFLLLEPSGRRALTGWEKFRAVLTGILALVVILLFAFTPMHSISIILTAYLLVFALGVYGPQWADVRRARREERLVAEG
jgi:tetratricopeptide (TPR) repeat protein